MYKLFFILGKTTNLGFEVLKDYRVIIKKNERIISAIYKCQHYFQNRYYHYNILILILTKDFWENFPSSLNVRVVIAVMFHGVACPASACLLHRRAYISREGEVFTMGRGRF